MAKHTPGDRPRGAGGGNSNGGGGGGKGRQRSTARFKGRGVRRTITPIHVAGHDVFHIRPIRWSLPILSRQFHRAPLSGRPSSKPGSNSCCPASRQAPDNITRSRANSPPSPLSIYVYDEFAVRTGSLTPFRFKSLVRDGTRGGVIRVDMDVFTQGGVQNVTLSPASRRMLEVPNAGGNSVLSEVMSCELLHRCYGAHLIKTEMEVEYWPEGGSITDYTCRLFDTTLGISVTRAMKFGGRFTDEDATRLLAKKLRGVVQSSQNSLERWTKQILHVWSTSCRVSSVLVRAYQTLPDDTKDNTVVFITTARNARDIFTNR